MSMMRAAGKKDAEKPRKKKTHHQAGPTPASADKDIADQPPATSSSTPEVTVWYFVINNQPITIAFRKKHRSVWVNSIEVETDEETMRLSGVAVKFEIYEKEAVIKYIQGDKPTNDTCELRYAGNLIQPKPISQSK